MGLFDKEVEDLEKNKPISPDKESSNKLADELEDYAQSMTEPDKRSKEYRAKHPELESSDRYSEHR